MKIHIAQKGDTLWNIAKKYNISFEQLEKANSQLSSPGAIYPGMKIKVPVEKVPVANNQERQTAFENAEEEQLEVTTESLEANNESNEEAEEEFLVRSDESPDAQTVEGGAPVHETQLNLEETLPPLPPYPTIPKPPFSLPVAPPPPIVNTSLSGSYGNQILQKQTELITKQSQQKTEQTGEGSAASTYTAEQQKEVVYTPSAATYPKPQVEYMGDVTQNLTGSQEQSVGYMKPEQYGKEGDYFQGSFQAVQDGYQVQQPYAYGGGIVPGYQPKAPCGCGGAVPQTAQFGTEYGQGVPYTQGHPYGYPMQGVPYGYQEFPYGYPMQGVPYGYQESPYGHPMQGVPYGYQEFPYGYPIHGVPYGYQEPSYGYPGYGVPYGFGLASYPQPYKYYAPPTPTGYPQHAQAPYYQAQDTAPVQSQPASTPTPVYPFPTDSFKGQGYPDYYRDEDNTNFGVPPIDEED